MVTPRTSLACPLNRRNEPQIYSENAGHETAQRCHGCHTHEDMFNRRENASKINPPSCCSLKSYLFPLRASCSILFFGSSQRGCALCGRRVAHPGLFRHHPSTPPRHRQSRVRRPSRKAMKRAISGERRNLGTGLAESPRPALRPERKRRARLLDTVHGVAAEARRFRPMRLRPCKTARSPVALQYGSDILETIEPAPMSADSRQHELMHAGESSGRPRSRRRARAGELHSVGNDVWLPMTLSCATWQ